MKFSIKDFFSKCDQIRRWSFRLITLKLLRPSLNHVSQHCVKCVQIRSFFWTVFSYMRTEYGYLRSKSTYSVRTQENTDQKKLRLWTHFKQCSSKQNFLLHTHAHISERYRISKIKSSFCYALLLCESSYVEIHLALYKIAI